MVAVLAITFQGHAANPAQESNTEVLSNIYDLEAVFVEQQYQFLPISPPSEDVYVHSHDVVVPVNWKKFPKEFTKQMYAEMDADGYPLYRVAIYEDPISRETVFLNSYGMEAYRLSAETGYDPYSWQKTKFQLESGEVLDEWTRWLYDPAHIAADFILIPEVFHDDYLLTQEEQAIQELEMAPMGMMMSQSMAVTNLLMAISATTNGTVELEIEWPTGFSDTLEIYSASDLVVGDWQFAFTNITTLGETNFVWVDTGSTNQSQRFYIPGNADLDEDFDGLASDRERYLYKTRSDLFDTDGDGLGDGWEMGYGFLPLSTVGTNGALGDTDNDGYGNLEEQLKDTNPLQSNSSGDTGTVATIRYYYDEDDRLTDFYSGAEVAQKTILTATHNIAEEVSAK